jgi:hypothetical protein
VDGRTLADVYADLGLSDSWQPLATVESHGGSVRFEMILMTRKWWFAGDRHASLIGPLVVVPEQPQPGVERVPAERVRDLCGRQVDWLEIPR